MPDFIPVREANTIIPPQAATIFKQQKSSQLQQTAHHVLWQDKDRAERGPLALPQPGPYKNVMRTAPMNNSFARVQSDNTAHHQLEKVSSWFEPILKSKLQDKARREGLSVSATLAAIAREYFQKEADIHYSAFIEPAIERSITRHLNNRDSRIISLLIRIAYDSGQTRAITTNILGLQPDISPDLLWDILAESNKTAKSNITKKTPQITELTEALEKWFFEQSRKDPLS